MQTCGLPLLPEDQVRVVGYPLTMWFHCLDGPACPEQRRSGDQNHSFAGCAREIAGRRVYGPDRLLALWRGHWGIEKRLHWVRPLTLMKTALKFKLGSAPQIKASLRNLTINMIRLAGETQYCSCLPLMRRPLVTSVSVDRRLSPIIERPCLKFPEYDTDCQTAIMKPV